MSTIYLSPPDVSELEETYVLDALRSGWVAPLGPHVDAFEQEMATRVGVEHAVALSSGTAALHLALVAWGVGPGDTVLTSTLTFAATANSIAYTGAQPFFVDCDLATGNLDPELVDRALTRLGAEGRPAPVVVPVDLLGKVADYAAIEEVARRHGARVLSDAAESVGSGRGSRAAGSYGDAAVLSFNGNKIMTTSGGGMLLTGDAELAARVRYLSTQARQPVAHYEHTEIGFNYRLSNVLAAIGRAQLQRLDGMLARRRDLRDRYAKLFAGSNGVRILGSDDDVGDNCWLTALIVEPEAAGWAVGDLAAELAGSEIETRPLWKPMHLQPVFAASPALIDGRAEHLFVRGLALPSGSALTEEQVERVFAAITDWLPS